jgi:hypothetical protein
MLKALERLCFEDFEDQTKQSGLAFTKHTPAFRHSVSNLNRLAKSGRKALQDG